jgi:hypothetical protein
MVMTMQPTSNAPQPHRVLRALWFEGEMRKPGDVLRLPRLLAAELRSSGKVEPAAEEAAKPAKVAKPAADKADAA